VWKECGRAVKVAPSVEKYHLAVPTDASQDPSGAQGGGAPGVGARHARVGDGAHHPHALAGGVAFLVGPGLLVLLDQAVVVLVDRAASNDARLNLFAHLELINIKTGFGLGLENSVVSKAFEILLRLCVNFV